MTTRVFTLLAVAFAAVGCDAGRHFSPEKELSATVLAARPAGADLTVSPYLAGMSLSWPDEPNETLFRIWRATDGPNGTFIAIATTPQNVTNYNDVAIATATSYCYKVQALQNARVVKSTSTVCATSLAFGPPAAYNFTAVWNRPNGVLLTWQDSSSELSGHRIDRALSANGSWSAIGTVSGSTTSYNDPNARVEQPFCYRVIATGAYGDAKPSNTSCIDALPAPPTNVVATSVDGHSIDLTWTDASAFEDGYRVRRSIDAVAWTAIATLAPNSKSYRDGSLASDTRYWYIVEAMKDTMASSAAPATTTTATAAPIDAPALTRVAPFSASVEVQWTAVAGAAGYYLDRSVDNLANWQRLASPNSIIEPGFYDYPGAIRERLVCYRVAAYNDRGQSPTSEPRCTAAPAAPTNLTAALVDPQTVYLTWTDNASVEDGFEIIDSIYDDWTGNWINYSVAVLPANTTAYRLTGLAPSTDHAFLVYAKRDGGWSDASGYAFASTGAAPLSWVPAAAFRVVSGQNLPSPWRGPVDMRSMGRKGRRLEFRDGHR